MVELTRRRAIEDVASGLFREHGYAATSVRDIARALDIQGASLYAHVNSKEDVLWAIVDRTALRFEVAAAAVLDRSGAEPRQSDPAATMSRLVRAHIRVISEDVGAAGVFVHEWRALGVEHRAAVLSRRDAYERRFRDLIEMGMSTGDFALTDSSLAATAVLSVLNGIPGWYDPAGRLSPERIADHFVEFTLGMLGASR